MLARLIFVLLLIPLRASASTEATNSESLYFPFEVRLNVPSMFFNWLTLESAYHINDRLEIGVNYTRYNGNVDSAGNMFFPTFRGHSTGINSNYYFPRLGNSFYFGTKVNYEDFQSVGHANPALYDHEGMSLTAAVGLRRVFDIFHDHLTLNMGGGITKFFLKTKEINRSTGSFTEANEQSGMPFLEFKIGYQF